MVEVNRIGNYGYYPQATSFTSQRREYRGTEDFKTGFNTPHAEEKNSNNGLLKAIGAVVVATGAYLFLKKTNMGKNLISKLKDLFKGNKSSGRTIVETGAETAGTKAAETTAASIKKPKKKPNRRQNITEHASMQPGQKLNHKHNKENVRSARHNKKQIIEETKLREEMEAYTQKDLDKYQKKSLGTPATAEDIQWIEKNNKEATNTIGDFMENQSIKRTKDKSGHVVLEQTKTTAKPAAPAPKAELSKDEQIANIKNQLEQNDKQIEIYKKGYGKTSQELEKRKAKLQERLAALQNETPAAPKNTPAAETPQLTPETKEAQKAAAWAEFDAANKPAAAPKADKIPTREEIWAKTEEEAAKVAKEEAEVHNKFYAAA